MSEYRPHPCCAAAVRVARKFESGPGEQVSQDIFSSTRGTWRKRGESSAWVAQSVERVLGKDEVTGSIPVPGSRMGEGSAGLRQSLRPLAAASGQAGRG